ncbi:hypothetical protein ACSFA3_11710 [Variovorax sp. RHLX14]|uniref:hypothetical protein n=1 Tax=Variovorax sp. RHLX14 TaxID=1259731 RepID=UPI003F49050C
MVPVIASNPPLPSAPVDVMVTLAPLSVVRARVLAWYSPLSVFFASMPLLRSWISEALMFVPRVYCSLLFVVVVVHRCSHPCQ